MALCSRRPTVGLPSPCRRSPRAGPDSLGVSLTHARGCTGYTYFSFVSCGQQCGTKDDICLKMYFEKIFIFFSPGNFSLPPQPSKYIPISGISRRQGKGVNSSFLLLEDPSETEAPQHSFRWIYPKCFKHVCFLFKHHYPRKHTLFPLLKIS